MTNVLLCCVLFKYSVDLILLQLVSTVCHVYDAIVVLVCLYALWGITPDREVRGADSHKHPDVTWYSIG